MISCTCKFSAPFVLAHEDGDWILQIVHLHHADVVCLDIDVIHGTVSSVEVHGGVFYGTLL